MFRKSMKLSEQVRMNVSPTGVGFSMKVGNLRLTQQANGQQTVSMKLGKGFYLRMPMGGK